MVTTGGQNSRVSLDKYGCTYCYYDACQVVTNAFVVEVKLLSPLSLLVDTEAGR